MVSRASSTTVLRPSPTQYLHATRPDHPAPMTITSYAPLRASIMPPRREYLSSNLLGARDGGYWRASDCCGGVSPTRADGRRPRVLSPVVSQRRDQSTRPWVIA